ncbi:MAG TPA: phosphatase PAP2 family protein [Caulobacteraceae bacterium]|jgi:acid phosphatase (class A)
MKRIFVAALMGAALALPGAMAQTPAPAPARGPGYLAADAIPRTLKILPPPPAAGSGRQADDTAIFQATRKLKGEPRWDLATADADLRPETVLTAVACDIGVTLDAQNAPTLMSLLRRSGADSYAAFNPPKDFYARPRPYMAPGAGDAPICVAKSDALAKSASYPSGHSTVSWAWGLILAELAPDRATEILARARSIGESRIVCGVHYLSDVEAGRTTGSILVAALHGDAAFRADLDKARAEVVAARAAAHTAPGQCSVADAAAAHPPY